MNTPPEPLPPNVTHLEIKAKLLMVLTLMLLCGSALFVMYSRGFFEDTQRLVLMAEDSEGVVVGMDLTFSGFPIGRVNRIELAEDGKVRILVDVTAKDAHWLRTSSVFTLVRGVVGSPNLRAYSGVLDDPALADGAVRTVLQGDISAEIPKVIAGAKELIDNLNTLTNASGPVSTSLGSLQTLTGRLNEPGGALQVLLGNEQDARKVIATLERSNALLAKLDAIATQTENQVFGPLGLMPQTLATIRQLDSLLGESRDSLKKADAILRDAQVISANAKGASADLAALRANVDANLRKIESLVNNINRNWPFARNTEIQLP
jgi:phospholipid/cholesterol/gamma-HCH transport system substrate-binding protein